MDDELKAQAQTIQGLAKSLERAYEENARLRRQLKILSFRLDEWKKLSRARKGVPDAVEAEIMNQLGAALDSADFISDYDNWRDMVDAAAEAIRGETDEWPKYYVPTRRNHGVCYYERRKNGVICIAYRDGHAGSLGSVWGSGWDSYVVQDVLRQISHEDAETIPRELPEEGTGVWAVWRMRQGEIKERPNTIQYRIREQKLQCRGRRDAGYASSFRWRESDYSIKGLLNANIEWREPTWSPEADNVERGS